MCGIAGICAPAGVPLEALEEMALALEHRGPDGRGFALATPGQPIVKGEELADPAARIERPTAGFAHRRLTIIDLTDASAQPMLDEDAQVALAYNGEIYNYVELREELRVLGHGFRTSGDTEVLMRSYLQWGSGCVERLVGMWAFAVIDLRHDRLLLSRDRFGIKPLYWTRTQSGDVAFASECKALRHVPGVRWEPDPAVTKRFLTTGVVDDTAQTFFAGVKRVPPATNLILDLRRPVGSVREHRYWCPPAAEAAQCTADEDAVAVRATLEDAVRIHLRSDVPVGTCLSGGIDSSGIVGLCDQLRRRGQVGEYTHHAFGYVPPDGGPQSEEHFMRLVADRTGAQLERVAPDATQFEDAVLQIVRQQDEPFGSLSIAAQWWVFRHARERGMKVMLDGQGADEIFGGYHFYLTFQAAQLLRRKRALAYLRFAARHRRAYSRGPIAWQQIVRGLALPGRARGARVTLDPGALLAPGLRGHDAQELEQPGSLHEMLVQQTTATSLPSLLRFEDRNSMAHSLEGRVPFLDHRVVELAFRLPAERKIDGMQPKQVLRRALADLLPAEVLARRDKIGFRADVSATRRLAHRHATAIRQQRTPWEAEWLDAGVLDRLIDAPDGDGTAEFLLWRALNLKLWLRQHWDPEREPLEPV